MAEKIIANWEGDNQHRFEIIGDAERQAVRLDQQRIGMGGYVCNERIMMSSRDELLAVIAGLNNALAELDGFGSGGDE